MSQASDLYKSAARIGFASNARPQCDPRSRGALFVYTVLLVEGVCSLLEFMKPNEARRRRSCGCGLWMVWYLLVLGCSRAMASDEARAMAS